jgi:hypothetical protein
MALCCNTDSVVTSNADDELQRPALDSRPALPSRPLACQLPGLSHAHARSQRGRADRPAATRDAATAPSARDARPDLAPDAQSACPIENHYVLLLGDDGQLYRFDASTLALTSLATVACGSGTLNSLTVSSIGPAYISNHNGDLCSVDTRTFRATRTAFNPLTILFSSYGMALLPDNTAAGQTLYIAVGEGTNVNHLQRIDLTTFMLASVGYIAPAVPWAELTAGPNGKLYGFAVGDTESLLLNIDPKTGSAIDVTKVPAGFSLGAFALVYWQDAFYLFLGDASLSSSTVYRYRKGDTQVATVGTVNASIIGAGVACGN